VRRQTISFLEAKERKMSDDKSKKPINWDAELRQIVRDVEKNLRLNNRKRANSREHKMPEEKSYFVVRTYPNPVNGQDFSDMIRVKTSLSRNELIKAASEEVGGNVDFVFDADDVEDAKLESNPCIVWLKPSKNFSLES